MTKKGHNSIAGEELKTIIARIQRLEEEKAGLSQDIREVYAEAKGRGYDTKTIRKVVRRQNMDAQKRAEEDELLELYEDIFA